ncbi:hypothetical protein W97_05863 [Coniosporium apollinis CBS 100218]|uniref:Autophagy-related protein 101 n=1 Tax=Coniosporium apollinis (strain CBS 100218) TaxID=1168221 RepID=R7YXK8_CONA1|nr:uncharacterized protein W97_05863 [Coniosporium apollinis CBS 100218]EON66617.1 hypothetical protein W97_05863 [Coniosporium apollinis CBS 100218]
MEQRRPPEYTLEVFADPTCVKDIIKGTSILHTIFFHRYFTPISPLTRDLLDLTLPAIDDVDLETLIDQRATALVRAIDTSSYVPSSHNRTGSYGRSQSGRGQLAVQFFEKTRRRKSYFGFGKQDEEVCWETWILDVTLATPRTDSDVYKVRRAMENSLRKSALKVVNIVNREKDHIPPILTTDSNFPVQILVNPKAQEGWGQRMGIGIF